QAALVTSRLVLTIALRQRQVAELSVVREHATDAIEWLEKELKVENPPGTEMLQISIKGDRPEELTILVKAITQAYLREIVNKEHLRRLNRLGQLKDIYAKAEEGLRGQRQTLKDLSENAVSGDDKA